MHGPWQLQDAKNRFSEMVEVALKEGPQTVTRRGTPAVVVLSVAHYQKLRQKKKGLLEFLLHPPDGGVNLDVTRAHDAPRNVDL